jgi:hypothetical protein
MLFIFVAKPLATPLDAGAARVDEVFAEIEQAILAQAAVLG